VQEVAIEEIDDNGLGYEISEEWAYEQIEKIYAELLEESQTWENPTETERLIAAFDELAEKHKITALHYAGYTMDDGEYEVVEIERTLIENGERSEGYCFYHGQDLERAVQGEGLWIAFQKIDNVNDSVSKEIARTIVDVLEKHGLKTDWDGKAESRISLPNFKWQR